RRMKKNRDNDQLALAGTEEAEILGRLGERVEKAVQMIQELRRERDKLRARVEELEARDEDVDRFRKERGEIRDRIEHILSTLETLEE
ncbi:MAG TPA: cell division protein ZapB, partial [Thermoanaerobaculia bacterium]|nr:cell division protein ZapB [Thermoanaerobaculia bacterium]